jgi:hypothetical protein
MSFTAESALWGHTSEETAFLVEDYPYGYRLRTQIRYWLETSAKHGDRLCSQTLNPKTGKWNKAKKSTYSDVGVMYLDEQGHVTWAAVSPYSDVEVLDAFMAVAKGHLSEAQRKQVAWLYGAKKAMEGVTVSVHEDRMTAEERAAHNAEQDEIKKALSHRAAVAATGVLNRGEV